MFDSEPSRFNKISLFRRDGVGNRTCTLTVRQIDMLDRAASKQLRPEHILGGDRNTATSLFRMGLIDDRACLTEKGERLLSILQ